MTPTLLTAPDQIASRCHPDPGTLNRQMPQDGPLGSWREDGAPSSTVPSPLQAACRIHPSPSCKALSQCRDRGWMLRKILTRDRRAATSYLAPLVIPATTARSGYPRAWAKPRGSGGWDRRGRRRRYLVGQLVGSSQFIYDGYGNLRLTIKHSTVKAETQSTLTISDPLIWP